MTRQILIDNIVRQTTILIAQLATSGGVRSPLAQIADRVFLDLARELDEQGISRKVSADMFGMALRSYRRRVRQLSESSTERGRSLWEAVLGFLSRSELVTREAVLKRFHRDEEALVKGVLNDLCETGLVLKLGSGSQAAYRAATPDEIAALRSSGDGLHELVWVLIYREGPLDERELSARTSLGAEALTRCLGQLALDQRIERDAQGRYRAQAIVLPLGSSAGWEAALFDHFQAVVKTMVARLRRSADASSEAESGGSTYTFSIWKGHPFEHEVRSFLQVFRARHSELRERIQAHNAAHARPPRFERVTVYGGLHVQTEDEEDETGAETPDSGRDQGREDFDT
jgi:hypothetical protein